MSLEFGWSTSHGYVSDGSKYQLLYTKPVLSFQYKTITYNSDPLVADLFIGVDDLEFTPTAPQLAELDAYIVAHAIPDNYATRNIPEFRESTLSLVGTGFTEIQTHVLVSNIWDATTSSVKQLLEVVFVYDVLTTGRQERTVNFSVGGLTDPITFSLMSLDGWTVSGGSNVRAHSYHLDLTKRTSDDMTMKLNGSTNGDMVVRVEMKLAARVDLPT